ncbi:hypothetical protein GDO78_022269, partial [Eleutherodactylus coqui]
PKGVINDWRRYKQLETEQSEEQKKELEQLVKRLSMTCKSHNEEEKDKQKQKEMEEKLQGKRMEAGGRKRCLALSTSILCGKAHKQ